MFQSTPVITDERIAGMEGIRNGRLIKFQSTPVITDERIST